MATPIRLQDLIKSRLRIENQLACLPLNTDIFTPEDMKRTEDALNEVLDVYEKAIQKYVLDFEIKGLIRYQPGIEQMLANNKLLQEQLKGYEMTDCDNVLSYSIKFLKQQKKDENA